MSSLLTFSDAEPIGNSSLPINCCFYQSRFITRIVLLAVFFLTLPLIQVEAGIFDRSNRSNSPSFNQTDRRESVIHDTSETQDSREQFTGKNLDPYSFASSHWTQSKTRLEKVCRAISSKYNDNIARDILQKLFVIDTQIFRENIKNSALAVKEINALNTHVKRGLVDISRVITSPGRETLGSLDKAINSTLAINVNQLLTVKKYLVGVEKTAEIAQTSYETLELIPSLSLSALDMMIHTSKQLMRVAQSNSEAFKGLLLNVQSSSEQISSGFESIKKTVRETLRFSDHFAIKQFPLINLPTPARERIYVQLNTLGNFIKGIDNTVIIGDSQVRNSSQQFTHMIIGFVSKASESLKYYNPSNQEKSLEQISSYARNQVSGLFLRTKEDISALHSEMAAASRSTNGNMPPAVNMESRAEYTQRRSRNIVNKKLPLFLLGKNDDGKPLVVEKPRVNTRKNIKSNSANLITSNLMAGFEPLKSVRTSQNMITNAKSQALEAPEGYSETVLFSDSEGFDTDGAFMDSELNILTQELGSDFFAGTGINTTISNSDSTINNSFNEESNIEFGSSGENISRSSLMAQGDIKSAYDEEVEYSAEDIYKETNMQANYENLEDSGESEIELMRFDYTGSEDDNLMPMMRMDNDILNF